jgi:hypothetical protein
MCLCSVKGELDMSWTECLTKMFYSGTAKYFVDGFVRQAYRGTCEIVQQITPLVTLYD